MRRRQSGTAAPGISIVRAARRARSTNQQTFCDPFARKFVPAWMCAALTCFFSTLYAEWRRAGGIGLSFARARYIDGVLQDYVREGLRQGCVLDAGRASRAHLFGLFHL